MDSSLHSQSNIQYMTETYRDHLNEFMRSIQRKFVESSLTVVIDVHSETDGLDKLVTSITIKCRENGTTFSEPPPPPSSGSGADHRDHRETRLLVMYSV